MPVTPQDSVDAANAVYGRQPGYRALHAKGTLLKGTFTATPEAAALTRAAHMQGTPVPVTARVSNGGGNPKVPDYAADVRGLAVKVYLPDGSKTDIVTQTVPRFPFHGPDGFVELQQAQGSGRAAAWKVPIVLARYPGALAALPATIAAMRPVTSYATCSYFGIHAYRYIAADGTVSYVRHTFLTDTPEGRLAPWKAKRLGRDYLQEDIRRRVADGGVRFTLELQIAGPGDEVDDPASVWPKERRRVRAGTLELTDLETERETGGDVLVFDPTRVLDGIELSADPVLQFRKPAYSVSVERRTGG